MVHISGGSSTTSRPVWESTWDDEDGAVCVFFIFRFSVPSCSFFFLLHGAVYTENFQFTKKGTV